ncbi:LON peptidase substrate-binding domain-containing protein [Marisediminicola sp. LYQ85]|uniref:LON peptidase substrate-binding domain-containing protein n=1 Tax=Marisediminicola sp. LYQ85 TaxID=3391062 RepID=UPI003982EBE6
MTSTPNPTPNPTPPGTVELPMFPLGSVLFPHMPIQLRLFEPRYLQMLAHLIETEEPRFGVVLIERGHEVGGQALTGANAEKRFEVGTVAEITQLESGEGFVGLAATGTNRIVVDEWLPDDPYPRALVHELPELAWSDDLEREKAEADQAVRRALAIASEFVEQPWAASVEISSDPVEGSWQLAGVAPVSELDQLRFLGSSSLRDLLVAVATEAVAASETLVASWSDEE